MGMPLRPAFPGDLIIHNNGSMHHVHAYQGTVHHMVTEGTTGVQAQYQKLRQLWHVHHLVPLYIARHQFLCD